MDRLLLAAAATAAGLAAIAAGWVIAGLVWPLIAKCYGATR